MSDKTIVKDIIPILFLTIIVCVSVILLSFTDELTRGAIEEQEEKQIRKNLKKIFPDMHNFTEDTDLDIYLIRGKIDNETRDIGFAFIAVGKGYGGDIKMVVGLKMTLDEIGKDTVPEDVLIKGMGIIPPVAETPGLGARIMEEEFQEQFARGITVGEVELRQEGGEIDAVTSATISSTAVVDGMRSATLKKIDRLKDELGKEELGKEEE